MNVLYITADIWILLEGTSGEYKQSLKLCNFQGDGLGEIAPQVLAGAVEESIKSITDLLEKYQMFKKRLDAATGVSGGDEADTINLFQLAEVVEKGVCFH